MGNASTGSVQFNSAGSAWTDGATIGLDDGQGGGDSTFTAEFTNRPTAASVGNTIVNRHDDVEGFDPERDGALLTADARWTFSHGGASSQSVTTVGGRQAVQISTGGSYCRTYFDRGAGDPAWESGEDVGFEGEFYSGTASGGTGTDCNLLFIWYDDARYWILRANQTHGLAPWESGKGAIENSVAWGDNTWAHIRVQREGDDINAYVNGTLASSIAYTSAHVAAAAAEERRCWFGDSWNGGGASTYGVAWVSIIGAEKSATDLASAFHTEVAADSIGITSSADGDTVTLTNDVAGSDGNQDITTNNVGAAAAVTGMSGGSSVARTRLNAQRGINWASFFSGNGFDLTDHADESSNASLGLAVDDTTIEIGDSGFQVKDGGIDSDALGADAVNGDKIADDAIDSEHIAAGAVDNDHLAGSIATAKLADGAEFLQRDGSVALTGDLDANSNKISGLAAPTSANDAATKTYVDTAIAGLDFQADVWDVQDDDTMDPGNAPHTSGERYILNDVSNLHANFGDLSGLGLGDGDIVEWSGTGWTLAYDVSAQGEGAICWDRDSNTFQNWDGSSWNEFGGLAGVTAGNGLTKSGNTINVVNATNGGLSIGADDMAINLNDLAALSADITPDEDSLAIIDGTDNASKKVTVAEFLGGAVDGSTLDETAGVIGVASGGINTSQLADDAVDADKLAADAVVNASVAAGAAIEYAKMEAVTSLTDIADALADADEFMVWDNDASELKRITAENLGDYIFEGFGGDLTVAEDGTVTIAADAVSGDEIADDAIDSEHIVDGAVDNVHLAGSIGGEKLLNAFLIEDSIVDAANGFALDSGGVTVVDLSSMTGYVAGVPGADNAARNKAATIMVNGAVLTPSVDYNITAAATVTFTYQLAAGDTFGAQFITVGA